MPINIKDTNGIKSHFIMWTVQENVTTDSKDENFTLSHKPLVKTLLSFRLANRECLFIGGANGTSHSSGNSPMWRKIVHRNCKTTDDLAHLLTSVFARLWIFLHLIMTWSHPTKPLTRNHYQPLSLCFWSWLEHSDKLTFIAALSTFIQ